jgi:AcrR family transcriptional regulator
MDASMSSAVSRQRRVGAASREETTRRLLAAAHDEFVAHGYAGATVSRIAERAAVTVQTLYLAWGSKRALLRADLERTLGDGAPYPASLLDRFTGRSPVEVTDLMAGVFTDIAQRCAVGWSLYRDAAATDAEVAADWNDLQRRRRATIEAMVAQIPRDALRPGLTRAAAIDTAWALMSPDCFGLMATHGGYDLARFRGWLARTLAAALLGVGEKAEGASHSP